MAGAAPDLYERSELVRRRLGTRLGTPVALEELKHKPGRRLTLRATGPRRGAIVKLYVSDRAPLVAARLTALAGGPPEPVVPAVIMVEPALGAVILSEVRGRPLRAALIDGDIAACERAGAALGAWHLAWRARSPEPLRRHTVDRELAILERRSQELEEPAGHAVRRAARSLSMDWDCSTVVHRDLYEEQLLVGERVGLIDLDDVALGPPELDVANLLAHVDLLELRTQAGLGAACEALLGGYAGRGPALDGALLDRCWRLSQLRVGCIHREPALLELAAGGLRLNLAHGPSRDRSWRASKRV